MSKTCNNCGIENRGDGQVIFTEYGYEAHEARHERQIRRMWIALIVAISMIFASNAAWLLYESQFETLTYEQTGEGINNVNYGEQGDLNNGAESQTESQEN